MKEMRSYTGRYCMIAVTVVLALAFFFGVPCFAEQMSEEVVPEDVLNEEISPSDGDNAGGAGIPPLTENEAPATENEAPAAENEAPAAENSVALFFARALEFVETYVDEIAGFLSAAVTMIAMAIFSAYQKSKDGAIFTGIKKLISSHGDVENGTQAMASKLAEVKAEQTELKEYYEGYAKGEAERSKVTAALLVEVMALIEITHIGYINNANIPQSMKNLMTSKYARCLSVINDDAELRAAYDEMRVILGISEATGDEKKAR